MTEQWLNHIQHIDISHSFSIYTMADIQLEAPMITHVTSADGAMLSSPNLWFHIGSMDGIIAVVFNIRRKGFGGFWGHWGFWGPHERNRHVLKTVVKDHEVMDTLTFWSLQKAFFFYVSYEQSRISGKWWFRHVTICGEIPYLCELETSSTCRPL